MTKRAFDKITAGLESAKAYAGGTADKRNYRVHVPEKLDVKKIRSGLGLSQEAFARKYGFALFRSARSGNRGAGGPTAVRVFCLKSSSASPRR